MENRNAPGGRREFSNEQARRVAASQRAYEIDVVITLVDGSEQTQHLKITAPDDATARALLAQLVVRMGAQGVLSWNEAKSEFLLSPAPSQIKSIRARLPVIVIAGGSA